MNNEFHECRESKTLRRPCCASSEFLVPGSGFWSCLVLSTAPLPGGRRQYSGDSRLSQMIDGLAKAGGVEVDIAAGPAAG
jgi:hypothetical protein